MDDPYTVLGVPRGASAKEIKAAYRRLARRYHPDLHPGDAKAETMFKKVSAAHELLSDEGKRTAFDRGEIDAAGQPRPERTFWRSHAERGPGARYHDFGDAMHGFADDEFLSEILRGAAGARTMRMRGSDVRYRLEVEFLEAARGSTAGVTMPGGKELRVSIPPGTDDGQVLRLKGQGLPGVGGGPAGDALIEVGIRPHPLFRRQGRDIHVELPVTLPEAVLGARIEVPTVAGAVAVTVPNGSNTGTVLRLRGRGLPAAAGHSAGDQYVTLKVVLPTAPDPELADMVARWAKGHPYSVRDRGAGWP